MIIVRGGMKKWLEEQMESAQGVLEAFVAKLHKDGELVRADVASFAFEWSASEIVIMAEAKVYANVLDSYNTAKSSERGGTVKTDIEWITFMEQHVRDQVVNMAQYCANKSSLPSAHLAKDGELQAWGKVADALKWAKIELGDDKDFPIDDEVVISPTVEKVYYDKPE